MQRHSSTFTIPVQPWVYGWPFLIVKGRTGRESLFLFSLGHMGLVSHILLSHSPSCPPDPSHNQAGAYIPPPVSANTRLWVLTHQPWGGHGHKKTGHGKKSSSQPKPMQVQTAPRALCYRITRYGLLLVTGKIPQKIQIFTRPYHTLVVTICFQSHIQS